MLEVRDLEFSFSAPVLKGVSFGVSAGEILAVLGPNGSGKTTLMKIIVGLLKPDAGQVRLLGQDIAAMSRRGAARLIGYVAQESAVRFPFTCLEFVLQGRYAQGRLIGFESDEDLEESLRAMALTETDQFQSRLLGELSGGERQRVMLARALASRPRFLALDEPLANLDIAHQVRMFDLLGRLTAEESVAAAVVTHDLNLASAFASRLLLLKNGRVAGLGPPAEVIRPELLRETFDAELLVDANPLTGAPRVTVTSSVPR